MVVFELRSRAVVVELQMTTKLNYWRYLPPEAAGSTLCFLLVTPVGGFHWLPLEESPRPIQIWKRGPELHGKKVLSYEEGGSNGLDGADILSRAGLALVTHSSHENRVEAFLMPIAGDSLAHKVSNNILGACLCQAPHIDDGPFLPLIVMAHESDEGVRVDVASVIEPETGSVKLGSVEVTEIIETDEYEEDFDPPQMAMGPLPEVICVSLSNIVVVIIRRKGLVVAYELEEEELNLIAEECIAHYVVDAVMRYSEEVGGAEIVILLADDDNPKDGRTVSFCFRSAVDDD
jgi:hypothetical protein